MNTIDDLFSEDNAVGSRDVAQAFDMSEHEARSWADELGVAKIGASFAWTREDVDALVAELDAPESEDVEGEPEDEDDEEDDDEGEEPEGDGDEK
jgi:hypothetical protein